jgi:hypothetical protein
MTTDPPPSLRIKLDAHQSFPPGPPPPLACGLCGALAPGRRVERGALYSAFGWDCACAARGIQVQLHDLDEVFDALLEEWGLRPAPGVALTTPIPGTAIRTESGVLHAAAYDTRFMLAQLLEEVRRQGVEATCTPLHMHLVPTKRDGQELLIQTHVVWARVPSPR